MGVQGRRECGNIYFAERSQFSPEIQGNQPENEANRSQYAVKRSRFRLFRAAAFRGHNAIDREET